MHEKRFFTFSFPVTFQICSPAYSTILEVSTVLLFRENRRHGTHRRTDGRRATFNAAPRKGRVINQWTWVLLQESGDCSY